METIKVRLNVEINTDQPEKVRHLLKIRGIREMLLADLHHKIVSIGMAAGSRAGGVEVNLVTDEAGGGNVRLV